jgi:hypothetical protein
MRGKITLEFPAEIVSLLDQTVFDLENSVDPTMLNKYLFYMPEVIRVVDLAVAQLKSYKRDIELDLQRRESAILIDINNGIDSQRYKNEQMRTAKVMEDTEYIRLRKDLNEVEYEIDSNTTTVFKYRNLMQALDNISKLRISDKRF